MKLFIGTVKGLFVAESNEARTEWTMGAPLMKGWDIRDVVADNRGGKRRLFAAVNSYVYGATVHQSDDDGANWQQLEGTPRFEKDAGRTVKNIWKVAPGAPDKPDQLYAGVDEGGLFRTNDGGDSWQEIEGINDHPSRSEWMPGAGGLCCHTFFNDPENPNRMWTAISAVGVFRSDDGGNTWEVKNEGLTIAIEGKEHKNIGTCPHCVIPDPTDGNVLYQQNHMGVHVSRNGGDTWERTETGLPAIFGFPIACDPKTKTLFIIPMEKDEYRFAIDGKLAVYRSTNAGESWEAVRNGLPQENAWESVLRNNMDVDGLEPGGVYFGTTAGNVFASNDVGETWSQLPCTLPRIQSITAVV